MTIRLLVAALVLGAAALAVAPTASASYVCLLPDANGACTAGGGIACPGGPQCFTVIVDDCSQGFLVWADTFAGPVTVPCP